MTADKAFSTMIGEQFILIMGILLLPRPGSLSFLVAEEDGGGMPCLPDLLGYLLACKVGRFG